MGLIQTQIGLSQRVRPQGQLRLSWEAFIKEQVERDEIIAWSQKEEIRELRPDDGIQPTRLDIIKIIKNIIP